MRKLFKVMFFSSLVIVVLLSALLVIFVVSADNSGLPSVGIIGGADGPTAVLITRTLVFGNPVFSLLCLTLAVFITSAVGWVLTKKK